MPKAQSMALSKRPHFRQHTSFRDAHPAVLHCSAGRKPHQMPRKAGQVSHSAMKGRLRCVMRKGSFSEHPDNPKPTLSVHTVPIAQQKSQKK